MYRDVLVPCLGMLCACSQGADIRSVPEERVHAVYAGNADRFDLECGFLLAEGSPAKAMASVSRERPEADFDVAGYRVHFSLKYPSPPTEIAERLVGVPHNRYSVSATSARGEQVLALDDASSDERGLILLMAPGHFQGGCTLMSSQTAPVPLSAPHGLAHINVHPHTHYDPNGHLAGKIEPVLADARVRNYVFLEGQSLPYAVSAGLPGAVEFGKAGWNPANGFSLAALGNASLHVASSGKFRFAPSERFPTRMLLTGGFAWACVSHTVRGIVEAFSKDAARELELVFPRRLLIESTTALVQGTDDEILSKYEAVVHAAAPDLAVRKRTVATTTTDLVDALLALQTIPAAGKQLTLTLMD